MATQLDIDDKRAEDRLRRSETLLSQAQRLTRTGSAWVRIKNHVITDIAWSDETARQLGFPTTVKPTVELVLSRCHPGDLAFVVEKVRQLVTAGADLDYEHRLLMPDGSVKHIHVVVQRMATTPDGIEYVAAVQDVTERHVADEALANARSELAKVSRATSLGILTASIAHEVNQPLAGIITNTNTCLRMLAADPPNVEGARETTRRTLRDGNRAADVITRLRALFSNKAPVMRPLDLNDAIKEVIALTSSELQRARVILRSELADGLPLVRGDRVELQQVMLNLLRNASDAMNEIEDRPRQLTIRSYCDEANCICLSVRDAGVGLNPQAIERLFLPFHTTKPSGMGIGLSVSRSIVESHGGRLWAAPNDDHGVTFSFSIPRQPIPS